jgi:hypothetical protein
VLFFVGADVRFGEPCLRVTIVKKLKKPPVDRVSGGQQASLIVFGRHRSVHHAEIDRTGADVDDQRVVEGIESVRDGERLGDHHQRIRILLDGFPDGQLIHFQRLGRNAYGGMDLLTVARPHAFDHMADEFLDRLLIALSAFADHAVFERPTRFSDRRFSMASSPKRIRLPSSF